jgi:hypothetical protein
MCMMWWTARGFAGKPSEAHARMGGGGGCLMCSAEHVAHCHGPGSRRCVHILCCVIRGAEHVAHSQRPVSRRCVHVVFFCLMRGAEHAGHSHSHRSRRCRVVAVFAVVISFMCISIEGSDPSVRIGLPPRCPSTRPTRQPPQGTPGTHKGVILYLVPRMLSMLLTTPLSKDRRSTLTALQEIWGGGEALYGQHGRHGPHTCLCRPHGGYCLWTRACRDKSRLAKRTLSRTSETHQQMVPPI